MPRWWPKFCAFSVVWTVTVFAWHVSIGYFWFAAWDVAWLIIWCRWLIPLRWDDDDD